MTMDRSTNEHPPKRRRLHEDDDTDDKESLRGLKRPISPPPIKRGRELQPMIINSPFHLTSIKDLPPSSNADTISLKDILGDPLISECWEFNYLHNIDFLMNAFDEDVRDIVKVNVIHGFWKHEDQSRLNLKEQASKYPNVNLLTAYMPEMFGTHHTKIIIHTANMIPFDWTNMTQAVWKSPLLPLIDPSKTSIPESTKIGSGSRFKTDLLNYLKAYDTKRVICKPLIEHLTKYDFSEIRGALIGSVPGKHDVDADGKTKWGWLGLSNTLKSVPTSKSKAEIVIQISSIASLGATDKWLKNTFFQALSKSKDTPTPTPNFKIIFPTADEIRRSLNGYQSGSAIHTKIITPTQGKQLAYLKPMLCHWAGDGGQHAAETMGSAISDAGRKRAAPHIKTYVRFGDSSHTDIDWMLVTSANLSKQAWGEATNAAGEVRVCSYEIGVLVWPELFGDHAKMVPTFKTDNPGSGDVERGDLKVLVGARMPYDLPIVSYAEIDVPWCASSSYTEPDWMGQTWEQ
ncbi:hypothetical protein ACMFMF_005118 [Clarireedia jacksonii]